MQPPLSNEDHANSRSHIHAFRSLGTGNFPAQKCAFQARSTRDCPHGKENSVLWKRRGSVCNTRGPRPASPEKVQKQADSVQLPHPSAAHEENDGVGKASSWSKEGSLENEKSEEGTKERPGSERQLE